MNQEYEEWKNDPAAQAEYDKWKAMYELKREQLPDPFLTDVETFNKAFNQIFGEKHESRS